MSFTIRALDRACDDDLLAYRSVDERVDAVILGGRENKDIEQLRAAAADSPYQAQERLLAVADTGEPIGLAYIGLPLAENVNLAEFFYAVVPQHARRGVGTALAERAAERAADHGRSKLMMWGTVPAEGDASDENFANNRIAARLGLTRRNVSVCRVAPLPVGERRLAELDASVADRRTGYDFVSWVDRAPEEYLDSLCVLRRQLELDQPDEDIDVEAPEYSRERLRDDEQRRIDSGLTSIEAVAVAPDGEIVAHTEVAFNRNPGTTLGWQENTLVMPDHRGRGLGLSVKIRTHGELGRLAPDLARIATWNSHVNPHMIAINSALGYQVAFRENCYQN